VLPPRPRCRLPDGRLVDLNIVGVDMAFDLAVMQLLPDAVRPVAWLEGASPPVGRIVLPVGPDGRPLSVGVVSVAVRKLDGPQEPKYDLPLRTKADRPGIFGTVVDGKYIVANIRGLARDVGILPGDRLFSIAGHRVTSDEDVAKAVDEKQSGDIVPVVVVRDGRALSFELPLLPAVKVGAWNRTWRCDDFPVALEYSPPVGTAACGGPIVDTAGRVVGVTVGQTTDATGWAIPADEVRKIVNDAKKGILAPWVERGASD
jgi:S1-C subfamily serine protease